MDLGRCLSIAYFMASQRRCATRGQANQALGFGPLIEKYLVFI